MDWTTHFSRRDQDQHLAVFKRISASAERVTYPWDLCEARKTGDDPGFFPVQQAGDQRSFILLQPDHLSQRAAGNHGNPVDACPRQRLDVEIHLQRHFVVFVQRGCRLHLYANVYIFRTGVRLLGDGWIGKQAGRTHNQRHLSGAAGDIVGYHHVLKGGVRELARN